jgi:pimeloyl-ACP methyl ester carboxylesterase
MFRVLVQGAPKLGAGGWLAAALLVLPAVGFLNQLTTTARDLAAQPPPGQLVDVGGHSLHIWCTGTGDPTVILDAGLGGTFADWWAVQADVATFTRVCSYDRAGFGYSDAGPLPRTADRIVEELRLLLDASGLHAPVVLAGASISGWYVRLFASLRSEQVAGVVLVDARHEDQGAKLTAIGAPENPPWIAHIAWPFAHFGLMRLTGISLGLPEALYPEAARRYVRATRSRPTALVAAASEMLNGSVSEAQVRATRRVLDLPVLVLTAGRRRPQEAEVMSTLQKDQLSISKRSCQLVAEDSGHAIMFNQPEVVVSAIRTAVDAHRSSRFDCAN